MTGWYKPMGASNGQINLVFIPQICLACDTGRQMLQFVQFQQPLIQQGQGQ